MVMAAMMQGNFSACLEVIEDLQRVVPDLTSQVEKPTAVAALL